MLLHASQVRPAVNTVSWQHLPRQTSAAHSPAALQSAPWFGTHRPPDSNHGALQLAQSPFDAQPAQAPCWPLPLQQLESWMQQQQQQQQQQQGTQEIKGGKFKRSEFAM